MCCRACNECHRRNTLNSTQGFLQAYTFAGGSMQHKRLSSMYVHVHVPPPQEIFSPQEILRPLELVAVDFMALSDGWAQWHLYISELKWSAHIITWRGKIPVLGLAQIRVSFGGWEGGHLPLPYVCCLHFAQNPLVRDFLQDSLG